MSMYPLQRTDLHAGHLTCAAFKRITNTRRLVTTLAKCQTLKLTLQKRNPTTIEIAAALQNSPLRGGSPSLSSIMRGVKSLTKALQSQSAIFAGCEARQTAPLINVAACLYSSATSPAHSIPDVRGRDPRASHYILPQQQLTSLLAFPQARCFNSGDDTQASSSATDFVDDAAESESDFGPSAILNAVAGVEEDAWLAAREDVWFFNRYMQTVLRFAQETTGLPWYTLVKMWKLGFAYCQCVMSLSLMT